MITLNGVTTSPFIQTEGDFFVEPASHKEEAMVAQDAMGPGLISSTPSPPRAMLFSTPRRVIHRTPLLPEDRAARALERGIKSLPKKVSQSRLGQWLKKIFWREVDLSQPHFDWIQSTLGSGAIYMPSTHTGHRAQNSLTEGFYKMVQPYIARVWGEEAMPHIISLGEGDGNFARLLTQRSNAFVLEVDRTHPFHPSPYRIGADIRSLPFCDSSFELAVASFALEYAGPLAYQEVSRILRPNGHLVALVHHQHSAFAQSHSLFDRFISGGFLFAMHFRPLHFILPKFLLNWWRIPATLNSELRRVAYKDKEAVIRILKRCGFEDIYVDNFLTPPMASPGSKKLVDNGFLVIAKKPRKNKK